MGVQARDPEGAVLGEIIALDVRPAQDLLTVRLLDGRQALVPFVAEIVSTVDLDPADPHVVIDAPPGLLDLDA